MIQTLTNEHSHFAPHIYTEAALGVRGA